MGFNLEGKKVFITGSTKGIGLQIAKKLEDYGCIIAINARNKSSLENAYKFFKKPVHGILGDMSSEIEAHNAIEEFINKFYKMDILICNIGSGRSAVPLNEKKIDWEKSFMQNLFSATNPILESKKYLSKSSGVITCISSICGDNMIENAPLTYSSFKSALNRYVINSSFYLAKENIRINAVSPGNVFFEGSIWEEKLKENRIFIEEMLENKIPLKKFVTPEEVSEMVAFLSSPLSASTTGQVIAVDAGQSVL